MAAPLINPDNIPRELKAVDRWNVWRAIEQRGRKKPIKMPERINGYPAATNKEDQWVSFEEAYQHYSSNPAELGLAFLLPEGMVGVDVDDCILHGGRYHSVAEVVMGACDTYTEISPSGQGIKMIAYGHLDRKMKSVNHQAGVEMFDGGDTNRFFTITGRKLSRQSSHVLPCREGLSGIQAMINEPLDDRPLDEEWQTDADFRAKVIDCLGHLRPSRAQNYHEWLNVGMALAHTDPSNDMLQVWQDWSERHKVEDYETGCAQRWPGFQVDESSGRRIVTGKSIVYWARQDGYNPDRYSPQRISLAELCRADLTRTYLIDDFLVQGEPMLFGGAAKALKTTIALDLTISLATATPFMGLFDVPNVVPVMMISGESGDLTIQEYAKIIADARGVDTNILDSSDVSFRLPKLDDEADVQALLQDMHENETQVVIIDPLYRSLRAGDAASNVFAMGEKLEQLAERIHRAGITPILLHHLRKQGRSYNHQPELEDLSQSGLAEFGRQFLLLKRKESYSYDGNHLLYFIWGGSAGHQGANMLEAYTGTRKIGLDWKVKMTPLHEWQEKNAEEKQAKKDEEFHEQCERLLEFVSSRPECGQNEIAAALNISPHTVRKMVDQLEAGGELEITFGARNKRLHSIPLEEEETIPQK
jgi:biotin operon repressor